MQIGRSVCSCTSRSRGASRSASSVSGTPMLTSSTCAPAATCSSTSRTTCDRSPARSASANALRPVGLMRSPMMQNGWSGADDDLARPRAQNGVHALLSRRGWGCRGRRRGARRRRRAGSRSGAGRGRRAGRARAAPARARARRRPRPGRARCSMRAIVSARDRDAGHLLVHEAQRAARRARGRSSAGAPRAPSAPARRARATKASQPLGVVADLQLQEAGAGRDLLRRALARGASSGGRRRVLDGADEERRRGLDGAARQVAPAAEAGGDAHELRAVEVEDAARLRLVAGRDVVAGQAADVLDAVQRRADDVGLAARGGSCRGRRPA